MIESLHIEVTNRCALKCIECPRTKIGIEKIVDLPERAWSNLSLEKLKSVLMCGTFGDAIYYPSLLEFFEFMKTTNHKIRLNLSTNGNYKSRDWWSDLASVLPKNHNVIFALDGTDNETLNKYRVGSNYENVIRNMETFINHGGTATWQFILFRHNEHQVDKARSLSNKYGCFFHLRSSYNYSVKLKKPMRMVETCIEASCRKEGPVICRIKNNKEIFVDPYGDVLPCCFITDKDISNKILSNIVFNVNSVSLDKVCNHWYLNRAVENTKNILYCNMRCKVPIESLFIS